MPIVNHPARTLIALLVGVLALPGCEALGTVVEFGFWTGVITVVIVVLAVLLLVRAVRR